MFVEMGIDEEGGGGWGRGSIEGGWGREWVAQKRITIWSRLYPLNYETLLFTEVELLDKLIIELDTQQVDYVTETTR